MKPRSKCIMRTARWVIVGVVPVDLKTLLKRAFIKKNLVLRGESSIRVENLHLSLGKSLSPSQFVLVEPKSHAGWGPSDR